MFRNFLLLAAFFGCTISAPIVNPIDKIVELLNPEFKEFVKSLTLEDLAVFQEVAKDVKIYNTEEKMNAAIKQKSPSLYAKIDKLTQFYIALVAKLPVKAQKFVKDTYDKIKQLGTVGETLDEKKATNFINTVISEYEALSVNDKTEIKKRFPVIDYLIGENSLLKNASKNNGVKTVLRKETKVLEKILAIKNCLKGKCLVR